MIPPTSMTWRSRLEQVRMELARLEGEAATAANDASNTSPIPVRQLKTLEGVRLRLRIAGDLCNEAKLLEQNELPGVLRRA